MHEVNQPRKPLIYYYFIAMVIILLFNLLLMPKIMERQIHETDYGTFMTMAEEQDIGRVQVQDNQILFTDKAETTIYKTGLMNDPGLVDRLKASGAVFSSEIQEETSPFISILMTWVLPLVIFIGIGQIMTKKLMDRAGGGSGSMSFNMGKSNAKVYVKSVKKTDKDLLEQILDEAGIKANKEQIIALYNLFCSALGTEYFVEVVLKPVIAEMKSKRAEGFLTLDEISKYL